MSGQSHVSPVITEAVAYLAASDPCPAAHDILAVEATPGVSKVSMVVREDMLNGHGICHGGMTFMLADTALAYAANAGNRATVTTSSTVSYLAPARLGDLLTATCRVVAQGPRAGVYDVEVRTQRDVLVAAFRGNTLTTGATVIPDPVDANAAPADS